jgi:FMN phosphatase YigB (HAD superfamily)
MHIKALVFDVFGTVVDWRTLMPEKMREKRLTTFAISIGT